MIDITPTILEAAGLPQPYAVNGVAQRPIEGVSMGYTFEDPTAPSRRTTQYFEMFGNRGIYHDGWTAVTKHRTPWLTGQIQLPKFYEDNWELYDTTKDFSQAGNLAAHHPEKLRELQELFLTEAGKYNVFPLDDRSFERGRLVRPWLVTRPPSASRCFGFSTGSVSSQLLITRSTLACGLLDRGFRLAQAALPITTTPIQASLGYSHNLS